MQNCIGPPFLFMHDARCSFEVVRQVQHSKPGRSNKRIAAIVDNQTLVGLLKLEIAKINPVWTCFESRFTCSVERQYHLLLSIHLLQFCLYILVSYNHLIALLARYYMKLHIHNLKQTRSYLRCKYTLIILFNYISNFS